MFNKFILASFLLVTGFGFAQEPPEMLSFRFIDSTGKVIYPVLEVIEINIVPYSATSSSKDFDDLKTERDTLQIVNLQQEFNHRWMQIDSTGYFFAPMTADHHYLGEEIKISATYNQKIMAITFLGQGMQNFGCWASGLDSTSRLDISFEEGNFLYLKMNTTERVLLNERMGVSNRSSKVYKGKISKDFKMIDDCIKIHEIRSFNGLNY